MSVSGPRPSPSMSIESMPGSKPLIPKADPPAWPTSPSRRCGRPGRSPLGAYPSCRPRSRWRAPRRLVWPRAGCGCAAHGASRAGRVGRHQLQRQVARPGRCHRQLVAGDGRAVAGLPGGGRAELAAHRAAVPIRQAGEGDQCGGRCQSHGRLFHGISWFEFVTVDGHQATSIGSSVSVVGATTLSTSSGSLPSLAASEPAYWL